MDTEATNHTRNSPTVLTEEIITRISGIISSGNYITTAANYAGVNRDSIYEWLQRGARDRRQNFEHEESESLCAQLHRAIEHALSIAEMRAVLRINRSAEGGEVTERRTICRKDGETTTIERFTAPDWRAAAWWLERYYRNRWGQESDRSHDQEMISDDHNQDGPQAIEASFLPDPRRRLALRVAASRMLEREKERMSALAQGGKAENVDSTRTFQGDGGQGVVGDGSIPEVVEVVENGIQGDCGRSLEGGTAVGTGDGLGDDVPTDGRLLDDKTSDIYETDGGGVEIGADEVQTHARASGTEVAAVEWDDDEEKAD